MCILCNCGYSDEELAKAVPPRNVPSTSIAIHCPNAAVAGSEIEIFDANDTLIRVIVPENTLNGQYFLSRRNSLSISSSNEDNAPSKEDDASVNDDASSQMLHSVNNSYVYRVQGPSCCNCLWREPNAVEQFGICSLTYSDPISARMLHYKPLKHADDIDDSWSSVYKALYQVNYSRRVHMEAFDAIRGFVAVQIFFGHFFVYFGRINRGLELGGANAVNIFFILSGFVLMVTYAHKGPIDSYHCGERNIFAKTFLLKRLIRIGPVYWLSVALYCPLLIMHHYHHTDTYDSVVVTIFSVLTTLCFVQTWFIVGVNGPLWSVCAQWLCYILFPSMLGPFHTVRNNIRFIGEMFLLMVSYIFLWFICFLITGSTLYAHVYPLTKLPLFVMGLICGSQCLTNSCVVKSKVYIQRWKLVCDGLSISLFLYFSTKILVSYYYPITVIVTRAAGEFILPLAFAIWFYAFTQAPTSISYQCFSWKPFQYSGIFSYSMYCLHFPVIRYYAWCRYGNQYFNQMEFSPQTLQLKPWESLPVYIILLTVSAICFYIIEKPCYILLNQLLSTPCDGKESQASRGNRVTDRLHRYENKKDDDIDEEQSLIEMTDK
jgi:peptidoglycan/LPS O-acetylase OafA/YrhL